MKRREIGAPGTNASMKHFAWILALTGCGGAPFTAADEMLLARDNAPDGGREAAGFPGRQQAEASGPDADGGTPEASVVEAAVQDSRGEFEADAGEVGPLTEGGPGPEASSCTPVAIASHACGQNKVAVSPGEYCQENYMVTSVSFVAAKTPAACQCAESYTCACLRAQSVSCSCTDTPGGPGTTCL